MPFDQRSLIHWEAWVLGGPRIPNNPIFFRKNGKKSPKTQKLKNVQRYAKISDTPFVQRSLIHREVWFLPCFVRQNQPKKQTFLRRYFRPLPNKKISNLRPLLPLLFPKDSESIKILDIRLWEVGAKIHLNSTSKVNTQTDRQTNRQTDILTYRKHRL